MAVSRQAVPASQAKAPALGEQRSASSAPRPLLVRIEQRRETMRRGSAAGRAFARYGQDLLVVWDSEDPATDAYLHGALLVGMALASRRAKAGEVEEDKSLAEVVAGIEAGLKSMLTPAV